MCKIVKQNLSLWKTLQAFTLLTTSKVINNQQTTHNEPNQNNEIYFTKLTPTTKNLIPSKKQTQTNNQQVELKEQLTHLSKKCYKQP